MTAGTNAEYDDSNDLVRKYIYGPGIDEPLCMIDVEDSNSVYYYHFDGLGSVVALSDAAGDTVQTYEYSIYGQVAASDPNHPNPYLFTGRRFDTETGLYYYRARYYNPYIGRFMQTDPVGYGEGMNLYAYCGNNPVGCADPSGMVRVAFYDPDYEKRPDQKDWFKEYADDDYFDYSIPMNNSEDILRNLRILKRRLRRKRLEITDVYFFDHCCNDLEHNVYGLQFGRESLWFNDSQHYSNNNSIKRFSQKLALTFGRKASRVTYHFRHCLLGQTKNNDRLKNLAIWTGGSVTAVYWWILPKQTTGPQQTGSVVEVDGPDYCTTVVGYVKVYFDPIDKTYKREKYENPVMTGNQDPGYYTY